MRMNRRSFIGTSAAALGGAALGGSLLRPAFAQETTGALTGTLNGGETGQIMTDVVWRPFQEAQGVNFTPVQMHSGDMLPRMIAETSAPSIDLYQFFNGQENPANAQDLLYKPLDLGEYSDVVDPAYRAEDGSWVGLFQNVTGILYNPEKMEKPTSLEDFFRPEYQGHIAVPGISGTYAQDLMVMMSRLGGGDESNTGPGIENIKRFSAGAPITSGSAGLPALFESQDIWMIWYDLSNAFRLKEMGLPVDIAYVQEGAPVVNITAAVAKNSPNASTAEAAIRFILQPEIQTEVARRLAWMPGNNTVEVPENLAAMLPASDLLTILDREAMSASYPATLQRWNREIAV
jgi:putative spermidine/putrescine transport system substrate-binding protein